MFAGKKIVVVGGSSGIGAEVARQLLEQDAEVIVWSREEPESLEAISWQAVDVTKPMAEQVDEDLESLDGVVYCPGTITLGAFPRLSLDQFVNDYEVNLLGAVRVLQFCLPALRRAEGASVVLYSTVATRIGLSYHASIAAAKAAVEGMAISLAAEFAKNGIRFNVIAPSLTDTPLAEDLLSTEAKRERGAERHPLGRIGQPDDIAAATLYLLSESSSWMSGQILPVEGGLSSIRP